MSFIDTNVHVFPTVQATANYPRVWDAIAEEEQTRSVAISRQIIREYLAIMTRPQARAPRTYVRSRSGRHRAHQAFHHARGRAGHLEMAAKSLRQLPFWRRPGRGAQLHDANIIATMLAHGENRLLPFNAKHFRRFEPLIEIIEP